MAHSTNLQDKVLQFRKGSFKKGQDFSIQDIKEIIKICRPKGWRDLQRNLGGVKSAQKCSAFKCLEERLIDYFDKRGTNFNEAQFDEWHKETCKKLISCFAGYVRVRKWKGIERQSKVGFTVGTAQKLINMTFKYIYCFDIMHNNCRCFFEHCHMAVDQFTCAWIKEFNKDLPAVNTGFSLIDNYDDYFDFQKLARVECKDPKWAGTYLIEKEFDIWEYYQNQAQAKQKHKKP